MFEQPVPTRRSFLSLCKDDLSEAAVHDAESGELSSETPSGSGEGVVEKEMKRTVEKLHKYLPFNSPAKVCTTWSIWYYRGICNSRHCQLMITQRSRQNCIVGLAVDLTQNYSSQCKFSAMISSVIIGPGASSNLVSCHRLVLFGNFIWGRSTEFTSRKKRRRGNKVY